MKRFTSAASAAILIAGLAYPSPATAATPSWLHVKTATRATAYNGSKVTIRPATTVSGRRVVTGRRVTVYRAGHRVAGGRTVHLAPGRYKTVTSGTYKTYTLVRQRRTRSVLHEGDLVTATCTVVSAQDAGLGDGSTDSTAECRNSYYPTQRPTDEEFEHYQVGDTYSTDLFFDNEYVTQAYYVTVRKYGANHRFTSRRRPLVVKDGGFRKRFTGSGTYTSRDFRPPDSPWRIDYSWDCSAWGSTGNMIIWVYRSNGDVYQLAANELDYGGSHHTYVHGTGRFYLDISSECDWVVTVRG